MSRDLDCPACHHLFDFNDYGDPIEQDEEIELQCPKCDAEFTAIASWMLVFTGETLKTELESK